MRNVREVLKPTSNSRSYLSLDEVLVLYVLGYSSLLVCLLIIIGAVAGHLAAADSSEALAAQLSQGRTRWALICLILAMAGLPPLFFFGCKLAILTLLAFQSSWAALSAAASLVVLGWVVYFYMVVKLLMPLNVVTSLPIHRSAINPRTALLLAAAVVVCLGGLLFFEEACFVIRLFLS